MHANLLASGMHRPNRNSSLSSRTGKLLLRLRRYDPFSTGAENTIPAARCVLKKLHPSTATATAPEMGCAFSLSSSAPGALPRFSGVRVIHTNGYVEDFPGPGVVTVAHVTGVGSTPPRYVLCSSAHLLQPGRGPFHLDDTLQPGTVYFLLPQSVFQSESSAVDLACLMNRLTALARKGCAASAPGPGPVQALFAAAQADGQRQQAMVVAAAPKVSSPARPAPWRPRLDRIDESIGRSSSSMRSSASSRSEA